MHLLIKQIPEHFCVFSEAENYQPQEDLIDEHMHTTL